MTADEYNRAIAQMDTEEAAARAGRSRMGLADLLDANLVKRIAFGRVLFATYKSGGFSPPCLVCWYVHPRVDVTALDRARSERCGAIEERNSAINEGYARAREEAPLHGFDD